MQTVAIIGVLAILATLTLIGGLGFLREYKRSHEEEA